MKKKKMMKKKTMKKKMMKKSDDEINFDDEFKLNRD